LQYRTKHRGGLPRETEYRNEDGDGGNKTEAGKRTAAEEIEAERERDAKERERLSRLP